jgi:hypothetical protein
MLEKTNNGEFFISPKSFQQNDMNRRARDSENNIITMSGCKHSSSIENLMEQFVDNFTFLVSKEKKGWKCKAPHKEEILTNDVLLILLSNEETKGVISFSEEDKDKMPIMSKKDIQEFENT